MDNTNDQPDIQAALGGDGNAYARIIRRYQQTIARRMLGFTLDRAMVEELTQDVFVQAYLGLARYRFDAPLEHWLQRIATRVGYGYWKREGEKKKTLSLDAAARVPAVDSTSQAGWAEILDTLPPRDRLVLKLLYVDDLSVAQAADLAGWSQTMVKVQAFRARKKLKLPTGKKGPRPDRSRMKSRDPFLESLRNQQPPAVDFSVRGRCVGKGASNASPAGSNRSAKLSPQPWPCFA